MGRKSCPCDCMWKVFAWICRFWGMATAIGLWGVGVEAIYYDHMLGVYLLVVAVLLTFLESAFLLNYFVMICTDETSSRCLRVWDGILWLDDWKKGLVYLLLSVSCFIQPHEVWLAIISGVMLVVSGLLYCIKTFKSRREHLERAAAQKPTYDKFDEVPDDEIEDSIINPVGNHGNIPVMSTVVDQAEILNV